MSPGFFRDADGPARGRGDFGMMIDSIGAEFEPEKISNEEHLESQLVIFLKAKFPGRKIDRQVTIIGNDRIDILIDGRYVLELKVPKQRSDLRNLGAQLEEYQERFPDICAIIFDDISNASLSGDIVDYASKYKNNYGIPSVIVGGKRRS